MIVSFRRMGRMAGRHRRVVTGHVARVLDLGEQLGVSCALAQVALGDEFEE